MNNLQKNLLLIIFVSLIALALMFIYSRNTPQANPQQTIPTGKETENPINFDDLSDFSFTGTATTDKVLKGETFYSDSKTKLTGTLELKCNNSIITTSCNQHNFIGNADENDVIYGKTFYNNSNSLKTGTWKFLGNSLPEDVKSGKTFYSTSGNLSVGTFMLTGTATVNDVAFGKTFYGDSFTIQEGQMPVVSYEAQANENLIDGNNNDIQTEESHWVNTSNTVLQDQLTDLYWTSAYGIMPWGNGSYTFMQAEQFCENLALDSDNDTVSETDWRLPTQKELAQAYINGIYNNITNLNTNISLWVSTTDPNYDGIHFRYKLYDFEGGKSQSNDGGAICVRRQNS